jgi:hypothetical protein
MLSRRRPNSDRSLKSLESRLRALPRQSVPGDLEARLLTAVRAEASNEMPRWAQKSRRRRLAVWAGAAAVLTAACSFAVLLWPGPGRNKAGPKVVVSPEISQPAHPVTPQQPEYSPGITPWLEARRDLDEAVGPIFTWPVQEKTPLMVSTALRPDLLDW